MIDRDEGRRRSRERNKDKVRWLVILDFVIRFFGFG